MKIFVDRLAATPTEFHFEGDPAWWRDSLPRGEAAADEETEPLALHVRAHRMGEAVYLDGEAEGVLRLECGRCLARYRHGLREPFRLILEPAGERVPTDPEAAEALARDGVCLGDEIEAGWFRGDSIDLKAFFREVVSLAIPVNPLCSVDCAGLCPVCGAELDEKRCECGEVKVDSPFAVLAALKGADRR
jgi:uncharacterized protein